jgi:hypothetical protein
MGKIRAFTGRRIPIVLSLALLAFGLSVSGAPQRVPKRKIACKTPEIAAACYWAHGRLSVANGNPTIRVWKIGTRRMLGILSGPGAEKRDPSDSLHPELPGNVDRAFKTLESRIFADFEICPLEPERVGVMQDVCIESAKNIVVEQ